MTDAHETAQPQDDIRDLRDRLTVAAVSHVPFDGWGRDALKLGAEDVGVSWREADRVFPGGAKDMINWHSRMADRRMLEELQSMDLGAMKIRERIATAVRVRLMQNANDREAIRKALTFLSLPTNGLLSAQLLYRTVDDIWFAAGDTATDWNYYTKRGLLAGVYSSTLLYWLSDHSEGFSDTWGFLDRRIADVMKVPKYTSRLTGIACFLPRRFNAMRSFRAGARSDSAGGRMRAAR